MLLLYNLGIRIYYFLILIYKYFNTKAKLWIEGRKNIFDIIAKEVKTDSKSIWFHFASLGEFEQGRPVLDKIKMLYPDEKIIITFFSPSGFELRKNYAHASHVFYLPLDTQKNAEQFIKLINPKVAVFTKYEYWYHYFNELNKKSIPLIMISAIFRKNQLFFKWYGSLNREILHNATHFFVQDQSSKVLLKTINVNCVTISGDTRFDRVAENAMKPAKPGFIHEFCKDSNIFIAGSTWPEDEKLVISLIRQFPDWKFIIAPHEINEEKINSLVESIQTEISIRYSFWGSYEFSNHTRVLIIDNMGMLSSLYQYAHIAYIGGGFGVGIHNTLEAAAFGVPVIFGPNYKNFREARDLADLGAAFPINNAAELSAVVNILVNKVERDKAGALSQKYVKQQTGASDKILEYLKKTVLSTN